VLAVIYLIFNEGYAASSDQHLRADLCEEAIRLCRILMVLCPEEPEVEGLLALMLLHHSRSATRLGSLGEIVTLEGQDRTRWDRRLLGEGATLVEMALKRGRPGACQLQAAIAALHAEAPSFAETDWRQIKLIYDELIAQRPNPVFELNRAIAVSYADGPAMALVCLRQLSDALLAYQPYHAVRADVLARLGELAPARDAYETAIRLSGTEAERLFLRERLQRLR
jgi:RNA polymerase sigma-70 factor (ECF subfamily)